MVAIKGKPPTSKRRRVLDVELDILIRIIKYTVKMSSPSFQKQLTRLLNLQGKILARLGETPPLLRGSFTRVHTRCGKPTCWCAQAAVGHPHARLTWSQEGTMRTRKVPSEHIAHVLEWTANHRRLRADRKKLQLVHTRIADLVRQHEQTLVTRTSKPLDFLEVRQKMPPTSGKQRQKLSEEPTRHGSQRAHD